MLLKDKYYKVLKENRLDSNTGVFLLSLFPQADVYRGYLPNKPLCPATCNIETIRECVELFTGKDLAITTINRCRVPAIASPQLCPLVDVLVKVARLEGSDSYSVEASIADHDTTYMELKGEFKIR